MRGSRGFLLFFCLCLPMAGYHPLCLRCNHAKRQAGEKVSFCGLLAHAAKYSGRVVVITVRISTFKEGALLWSPECSKKGVGLLIEEESGSGVPELRRRILPHPDYGHPLIATLTGVLDPKYYDKVRHRKRAVFKVIAARDIHRSPKRELLH